MTREDQLEFCKKCIHKVRDFKKGIVCKLTMKPADFKGECKLFEEEIIIEKNRKKYNEAQQRSLFGKPLLCPLCQNDMFTSRRTLMTTKVAAFFKLEFYGHTARNFICTKCKHVLWFY